MKYRVQVLLFLALYLLALAGCASIGDGRDPEGDLVFVNTADWDIFEVVVHQPERSGGTRHADNTRLFKGEGLGFEVTGWPATLEVYGKTKDGGPLAKVTIPEAPGEGGRWYVTAAGPGDRPELRYSADCPE